MSSSPVRASDGGRESDNQDSASDGAAGASAGTAGGEEVQIVAQLGAGPAAAGDVSRKKSKCYTSPIWDHFEKDPVDLKKAKCLHCGDEVSVK